MLVTLLYLLLQLSISLCSFFFFRASATSVFYTFPYTTLFRSWSLAGRGWRSIPPTGAAGSSRRSCSEQASCGTCCATRSEEHTSELQSRFDLVCRLLLEKKKRLIRRQSPSSLTFGLTT